MCRGLKNDPDSANVGQTILTQTDENGNHISRSQAIVSVSLASYKKCIAAMYHPTPAIVPLMFKMTIITVTLSIPPRLEVHHKQHSVSFVKLLILFTAGFVRQHSVCWP